MKLMNSVISTTVNLAVALYHRSTIHAWCEVYFMYAHVYRLGFFDRTGDKQWWFLALSLERVCISLLPSQWPTSLGDLQVIKSCMSIYICTIHYCVQIILLLIGICKPSLCVEHYEKLESLSSQHSWDFLCLDYTYHSECDIPGQLPLFHMFLHVIGYLHNCTFYRFRGYGKRAQRAHHLVLIRVMYSFFQNYTNKGLPFSVNPYRQLWSNVWETHRLLLESRDFPFTILNTQAM